MIGTKISRVAQNKEKSYDPAKTFSRHTEPNPKRKFNDVTLQSGKELEDTGKKSEDKAEKSGMTQLAIEVVEE